MLGLNPLGIEDGGKKLSGKGVAQALRWAIMAELDAVNFYEQFAERIEDEAVRKTFLDVANEEKEHIGEFLTLLLRVDPELGEYIRKGASEVEEDTGIKLEL